MNTEDLVYQILQGMSLTVERIPTAASKTPDFYVTDGKYSYLIEVKDRFPNAEEMKRRRKVLESGAVYDTQEKLSWNRNISKVICGAVEQLSSYTDKQADFRIVWLIARTLHPEVQIHQLEATLYGSVDITDRNEWDDGADVKPCYFFTYSSFFELSDKLDGAVVSDESRGKFCLNPFSAHYQDLKQSKLCTIFSADEAIVDPTEEEAAEEAYIADWKGSRKAKQVTLARLKENYNKPDLLDLEFTHLSGQIVVPRQKDDI